MNLEIRKKGVKNFEHVYNSYKLTFSDLRIAFNGTTQNVLITRENGAFVIKREGFNVTDVSVYDDTSSGTEETFSDVTVLANRLIELGYIAFYQTSEGDAQWGNIDGVLADQTDLIDYINTRPTDGGNASSF